ncbi:zinc finger domain-containing protein [Coprobacter sp.]
MIEIPESVTVGRQATEILTGKRVSEVINATSAHRFTWYNGDPEKYSDLLVGREIKAVNGYGAFIDILFDSEIHLLIGDGTNMRYYSPEDKMPVKFQLLVVFEDRGYLVFTVAMYGGIYAFQGRFDNPYYQGSISKLSVSDNRFDETYFKNMIASLKKDISVKALLATEQRIPGLGNGVLQDILFNARIHPKRKVSTLNEIEKVQLFGAMKSTIAEMIEGGGRNTEKDLFGIWGSYKMILSKNTYKLPCPRCGSSIVKEAYLGGSVYYCPQCQK